MGVRGHSGGKLAEAERLRLIEDYRCGLSFSQLAEKYGVARQSAHKLVRSRTPEIIRPLVRHSCQEAAFDTVTEASAYWIGFLMADGCIQHCKNSWGISLALAQKDVHHLNKLRDFLQASSPVCPVNKGTAASLVVTSASLAAALATYGVVPQKTHTAQVKRLELNRNFWRGVVDGDGCVRITKDGRARLDLIGSLPLMKQYLQFVQAHLPTCRATVRPNRSIYAVLLHGSTAAKMIKVLYSDCETFLDRKYLTAQRVISLGWPTQDETSATGQTY